MRDTPAPPRLIGGGLVNVTNSFVVLNGSWGGWGVPSCVVTVVGDVMRAMCPMVRLSRNIIVVAVYPVGYCMMW